MILMMDRDRDEDWDGDRDIEIYRYSYRKIYVYMQFLCWKKSDNLLSSMVFSLISVKIFTFLDL